MSLDSYSGLKDEIVSHLDDDNLTAYIDSFIDLAEARHAREIRIREMIVRSTAPAASRYLALPTGFLQMSMLRLLTDPVTVLSEVSLHEMNRNRLETAGKPTLFTVHEEIEFDRAPDESYTAEMIYYAKLTPLSADNTSNALLVRAPDAYLYAALGAAAPFLGDDERLGVWAQLYQSAVDALNVMDRRRAGPLISRVAGATP